MNHPPRLTYSGLTIILSQPSRFDTTELLSGNAGAWFCGECLRPEVNRWQCDIYDCDTFIKSGSRFRDGTKVVLCLGQKAQQEICRVDTSLGEQRGSPIFKEGYTFITSYLAQDTHDFKDYEGSLNPHLNGEASSEEDSLQNNTGDDEDDLGEKSRHGKTARSNWRYWLKRDTKKALRILKHGITEHPEPAFNIYSSSSEIIDILSSYKNEDFYLDLETDSDLNITCFGFSFTNKSDAPVYVVPVHRYNYTLAYDGMGSIFRALAKAVWYNTTIAHNGAGFDFFVLPFKYRIPIGSSLYDTMISHQRCFPEVEKSLGHCISNFTDLPYHKDEGIFEPNNETQEYKLWNYNAKDVWSMREVKAGITSYAQTIKGLDSSILQVNESIRPYLITTLQGIRYRRDKVEKIMNENDRRMTQYLRMVDAAIGKDTVKEIRRKSESGLPSSNVQCVRYFHDICGYPVQARSKKTGRPKLDEKSILKLALKIRNPVMDVVLAYRKVAKESGSLKFNEWPGITKHNQNET